MGSQIKSVSTVHVGHHPEAGSHVCCDEPGASPQFPTGEGCDGGKPLLLDCDVDGDDLGLKLTESNEQVKFYNFYHF